MKSNFTCLINSLIAISFFQLVSLSAIAQLVPIPINGLSLNQDLIAEGAGNDLTALTSVAIGNNYVLYDETFKTAHPIITAGGLPADGLIIKSSDSWQLKPYTGNNALFFPKQSSSSLASITLNTPAKYSKISLLTTSVNGPVIVNITLTFADNSATNYGSFSVDHWLAGDPFVIQGFGGIVRSNPVAPQEGTPDEPRLYQIAVNLSAPDQLKNITSIDITNTDVSNDITLAFFAVSGIPILALPITFSSLSAQYQSAEKKIVLNWEAQTGLNSSGFEVQRSADASIFSSIATVNSNKTMGTSKYSYIDNDLQNKQAWFYRIKETLAAGTINYSHVINVKTAASAYIRIIQSGGYIHLATTLPDKSFIYKIVDLHGGVLKSGSASAANQFAIDIHNLPSGPYILNILSHTETKSIKFVR